MGIIQRGFDEGKVGHRFSRELTELEHRLLLWAMRRDPGMIFYADGSNGSHLGSAIGAVLCPCEECQRGIFELVTLTQITISAQQAGDSTYTPIGYDQVEISELAIGVYERSRIELYAKVASQTAALVAQEAAKEIQKLVRREVQQQLRTFTAGERKKYGQVHDRLVRMSFEQQARMMGDEPGEVQ